MLTKAPRGTKDITPKDAYKWNYVENKFREAFGFDGSPIMISFENKSSE